MRLWLDDSSGKFRCDQPGDSCPLGLSCVDGICRTRTDEMTPAADLAPAPAPDPGAATKAACASGGTPLLMTATDEIFACKGRFEAGKAAALCKSGYRVCGTQDEGGLSALAMDGRCELLAGFFAAQLDAALSDDTIECQAATGTRRAILLGCGSEERSGGGAATAALGAGCRGLHVALPCDSMASGWSCTSRLADAVHTTERGGVLCCKAG